ncbi:MAG: hypothetical protein N3C12_07450 [Candidatus Binatia bacterium]|nr:hypothetical protein [Candidatus Binatia bacterium]
MAEGGWRRAARSLATLAAVCGLLGGVADLGWAQGCTDLAGHFSAQVNGSTSGSSTRVGSCGGGEAPEAVLAFTAPRAGAYTFDTLGSSFDTVLYVLSHSNTELACNDDVQVGVDAWSRVAVTLAAGQTVQVVVDGFSTQSGEFVLRVNADCPLPFRADARDVGNAATWVVSGSTNCAPAVLPAQGCSSVTWGRGSTFVYTAPFSGTFEFSTEGSEFDTLLAVRLGTCSGVELRCNDDVVGGSSVASRLRVDLAIGQTVVLVVAGKDSASGRFVLSGTGVPFTPTVTFTRTRTRTPTATRSFTPRPSATNSPTPSFTRSPSPTPTASATATSSRSATATRSFTATATPRATLANTPAATAVATATATASGTPTPSRTPVASPSATASPTATLTALVCCEFPLGSLLRCELLGAAECHGRGGMTLPVDACTSARCSPPMSPTGTITAMPTRTLTSRPTLTPLPSSTPAATVSSALTVSPTQAQPGARIVVHGRVASGHSGVRLWFDDTGGWVPLGDLRVDALGAFAATVRIPESAEPGMYRICAAAVDPGVEGRDLVCAPLALESATASLTVLTLDGGVPQPGVRVHLHAASGAVAASAESDEVGIAEFLAVAAGVYDVRAVCEDNSSCSARLYFPPSKIVLAPGSRRAVALRTVTPPPRSEMEWVGALVLPAGLVASTRPLALPFLVRDPWAFPSLEGLGLPPLIVRFWGIPSAPPASNHRAVDFRVVGTRGLLLGSTARRPQPVYALDPEWNFPAFVADVNLGSLPGGEVTLEVQPTGGTTRSFPLAGEPLALRWGPPVRSGEGAVEATVDDHVLQVQFATIAPRPQWTWDLVLQQGGGQMVPWSGTVSVELVESWGTKLDWQGTARARMTSTLAERRAESNLSLSLLRGARLTGAAYRVAGNLQWERCFDVRQRPATATLPLELCENCPREVFARDFSSSTCVEAHGSLQLEVAPNLHASGRFALEFAPLGVRSLEEPAGLCQVRWWAKQSLGARASVSYNSSRSPAVFVPEAPCLALSERWIAGVQCVGRMFVGPQLDFMATAPCALPVATDRASAFTQNPNPVLAVDESGWALLLSVAPASTPAGAPSTVAWEMLGGAQAGETGSLGVGSGFVDRSALASVGPDRMVAVWVESGLHPQAALEAELGALNASAELATAEWIDGGWSASRLLTQDDVADGRPVLVRAPEGALLFWLRAERPPLGSAAASVFWGRYGRGTGWQLEGPLSSASAGTIRDLAAGELQDGTVVVAWLEDRSSGGSAVRIRHRSGDTWMAPEEVVLPRGVRATLLRFVAGGARPAVLVRAHQEGTRGPGGDLYWVERGTQGWSTRKLTEDHSVDEFWPLVSGLRVYVFFRNTGGGSLSEGNGDLWAMTIKDAAPEALVRLTSDGAGHVSPVAVQRGSDEVVIADVHQRAPTELPRVVVHRWLLLPDLALEDARWEPPTGAGIGERPLREGRALVVRIVNQGLIDSGSPFSVRLRSGEGVVGEAHVSTPLAPGAATEITLNPGPSSAAQQFVVVVDEENRVAESEKGNNVLRVDTRPEAPQWVGYSADESSGDVVLQWLEVGDAAQYRVYRANDRGQPFELWTATLAPELRDPGALLLGRQLSYRITAVDEFGRESEPSSAIVVDGLVAPRPCTGDCNGDGVVTIDELLLGVNIALEVRALDACPYFDVTADGAVTVDELLLAVGNALSGCP